MECLQVESIVGVKPSPAHYQVAGEPFRGKCLQLESLQEKQKEKQVVVVVDPNFEHRQAKAKGFATTVCPSARRAKHFGFSDEDLSRKRKRDSASEIHGLTKNFTSLSPRSLDPASSSAVGKTPATCTGIQRSRKPAPLNIAIIEADCPAVRSPSQKDQPAFSRLTEYLYVGSARADMNTLRQHGVTHVLNCAGQGEAMFPSSPSDLAPDSVESCVFPPPSGDGSKVMERCTLFLRDNGNDDMLPYLPGAISFIEDARSRGGAVFIHCRAGISRSGAFACAYFMWKNCIHYADALRLVKASRPAVDPRTNFAIELREWQWQRQRCIAAPRSLIYRIEAPGNEGMDGTRRVASVVGPLKRVELGDFYGQLNAGAAKPCGKESAQHEKLQICVLNPDRSKIFIWLPDVADVAHSTNGKLLAQSAYDQILLFERASTAKRHVVREGKEPVSFWQTVCKAAVPGEITVSEQIRQLGGTAL